MPASSVVRVVQSSSMYQSMAAITLAVGFFAACSSVDTDPETSEGWAEKACVEFQQTTRAYSRGGHTAAELGIDLAQSAESARRSDDSVLADRADDLRSTIDWPHHATRTTTPEFADAAEAVQERCAELFS